MILYGNVFIGKIISLLQLGGKPNGLGGSKNELFLAIKLDLGYCEKPLNTSKKLL